VAKASDDDKLNAAFALLLQQRIGRCSLQPTHTPILDAVGSSSSQHKIICLPCTSFASTRSRAAVLSSFAAAVPIKFLAKINKKFFGPQHTPNIGGSRNRELFLTLKVFTMSNEHSLIDLRTDLVFGPYPSFNEARGRADYLNSWEIMRDYDETVLDWSDCSVRHGLDCSAHETLDTTSF
jgi:hypothetical protein